MPFLTPALRERERHLCPYDLKEVCFISETWRKKNEANKYRKDVKKCLRCREKNSRPGFTNFYEQEKFNMVPVRVMQENSSI